MYIERLPTFHKLGLVRVTLYSWGAGKSERGYWGGGLRGEGFEVDSSIGSLLPG